MIHIVWINFDLHQIIQKERKPDEPNMQQALKRLKNIGL
jgi:hypothetical protein